MSLCVCVYNSQIYLRLLQQEDGCHPSLSLRPETKKNKINYHENINLFCLDQGIHGSKRIRQSPVMIHKITPYVD